jgi:hypothetical protein
MNLEQRLAALDAPKPAPPPMAVRHTHIFAELTDILMTVAREMKQAVVEAYPDDKVEVCATIEPLLTKVARSIRQTIALEAKLADKEALRKHTIAAEAAQARAATAERERFARNALRSDRKNLVELAVEKAIRSADIDPDDAENLYSDLYEQLHDYRSEYDFSAHPVGETVMRICKDLGLQVDPALWEDEPWAQEEIRLKPAGSPFADYDPDDDPPDPDGETKPQERGPPH